jgi:folate-binding protein YgfZ
MAGQGKRQRPKDKGNVLDGAFIGAVQPSIQLAVAGKDRASFLQGLLTNDIQALEPGSGCYAAWLTPQGRMLTDLHVLESAGMALLDVPRSTAAATLARLEQFLFSEEVTLSSLEQSLQGVWIHGTHAPAVLRRVLEGAGELEQWSNYHHQPTEFRDEPVVVARIDQLEVPGFSVYLPPARADVLTESLIAAGAVAGSEEAIETARIEARYPLFGVDMTEETIPLEAGIEDRAISTSKGCYVGQEVIIRVLHRGHGRVAKKLVGLSIDGPKPEAGAKIFAGEREAGRITSAAVSPGAGTVALGYVHRDFLLPGTALTLASADGSVPARLRS